MFLRGYVLGQVSAETKENSGRNSVERRSLVIVEKYLRNLSSVVKKKKKRKKKEDYIFFLFPFFPLVLP